jgi:predicted DNA-binding transcriptional regulator AlpA
VRILWSGGTTTSHTVTCPPLGWHSPTDPVLVEAIRTLAQTLSDPEIAERLNAQGHRTKTGKAWTYNRVASMRKQHGIRTGCPLAPSAASVRGDGLLSVSAVAQRLQVSRSLVHVWIQQGVLTSEQRVIQSYRWVRLSEDDIARLDGQHDWSGFPTVHDVMQACACSRDAVWDLVRSGAYTAYRHRVGQQWEWRLCQATLCSPRLDASAAVRPGEATGMDTHALSGSAPSPDPRGNCRLTAVDRVGVGGSKKGTPQYG